MENVMQTSGYAVIGLSGMSPEHLNRVREIGLDKWLDEYKTEAPKLAASNTGTIRCALGSKCFSAYKRKAAFGTGKYCSDICKGAARAAKNKIKAEWAVSNPEMVGIQ